MPDIDTIDPMTLDWTNDPTVLPVDLDGHVIDWPDGGDLRLFLPSPFHHGEDKIVYFRPSVDGWVAAARDDLYDQPGLHFTALEAGVTAVESEFQVWDSWQEALVDCHGEPFAVVEAGDGGYTLTFGQMETGENIELEIYQHDGAFVAHIPGQRYRSGDGADPHAAATDFFVSDGNDPTWED
jgi:hypothetical protein